MRANDDRSKKSEELFRALRGREGPELDSAAAWRRLRAALPERAPAAGALTGGWRWRYAAVAATVLLVASVAVWQGWGAARPQDAARAVAGDAVDTARDRDLVLLAGAVPEAEAAATDAVTDAAEPAPERTAAATPGSMRLDVRLLREGAENAPALGAGGADATADIGPTLQAVMPGREYGIVGRWQGLLVEGVTRAALAPGYTLSFHVDEAAAALLRSVQVSGDRGPLVAQEIRLEAGRVYLFGVRDAAGGVDDLLLAVRLEPAAPPRQPSR